jgi:hypothetical protein
MFEYRVMRTIFRPKREKAVENNITINFIIKTIHQIILG